MRITKKLDWREKCQECGFCWWVLGNEGKCVHPKNDEYSCIGFRQDVFWLQKILLKDIRCGSQAIFFEPRTFETDKAKRLEKIALKERFIEAFKNKKESVCADRLNIKNVMSRRIEEALQISGYDICLCHNITYTRKNEEGIISIVGEILRSFDVEMKEDAETKEKEIAEKIARYNATLEALAKRL